MTLMPVSNISVFDSSWSNAGALRWIPHRSLTSRVSPSSRLRHSPRVLNTRPRVASPTGTVIGPPVSVTSAPRTSPSVGWREIARTMPSPMCWATSSESVLVSPRIVSSVSSRLYISGIESAGNSMSTTGPMTRAIRPVLPVPDWVWVSSTVAVIVFSLTHSARCLGLVGGGVGVGQRVLDTDDLADLLGDAGVSGLVGDLGVLLDELFGVVGRRLHRLLTSRQLGGRGLEQREEDAALDVPRQQLVEHRMRRRLELVERQRLVVLGLLLALDDLQRQHPYAARLLHQHRPELRVHEVHLVDAVLGFSVGHERTDQRLTDVAGVLVMRLVGEARPGLADRPVAEAVVGLALAPRDEGDDLLALGAEPLGEPLGLLEHARGVGAREAAVAGHDQHGGP